MSESKKILFVCVENAGRSQMAEAFFRKYSPKGYEPISAGTKPSERINPVAVQAMKEIGIGHAVFMRDSVDWNIEDPKEKPIDKVREIRDDIEQKVMELCKTLE